MRNDNRYVAELPSGIIKHPAICVAGTDLRVNDVVYFERGVVFPLFDDSHDMYGVVATKGVKDKPILIATRE